MQVAIETGNVPIIVHKDGTVGYDPRQVVSERELRESGWLTEQDEFELISYYEWIESLTDERPNDIYEMFMSPDKHGIAA